MYGNRRKGKKRESKQRNKHEKLQKRLLRRKIHRTHPTSSPRSRKIFQRMESSPGKRKGPQAFTERRDEYVLAWDEILTTKSTKEPSSVKHYTETSFCKKNHAVFEDNQKTRPACRKSLPGLIFRPRQYGGPVLGPDRGPQHH